MVRPQSSVSALPRVLREKRSAFAKILQIVKKNGALVTSPSTTPVDVTDQSSANTQERKSVMSVLPVHQRRHQSVGVDIGQLFGLCIRIDLGAISYDGERVRIHDADLTNFNILVVHFLKLKGDPYSLHERTIARCASIVAPTDYSFTP